MRYFLVLLVLSVVSFAAAFNGPAYSQRHAGYCDHAESTAAALNCINRHHEDAKTRLSEAFKALMEAQGAESRPHLAEAQKNWILYRDAHCAWESSLTDTPSLTRVYELSCLTAMTGHRLDLLTAIKEREEAPAPREFGSQPRWMIALAHDHPDIYWRYGEWKSGDINCDGADEQVMTGISVIPAREATAKKNEENENAHHEIEIVIAISDNPQTGRPKAKLLRLPVDQNRDTPHLCRPAIRLELKDQPALTGQTEAAEAAEATVAAQKSCKIIEVSDRTCAPVIIFWDGKTYAFKTDENKGDAL